jgi:hypothetical protein
MGTSLNNSITLQKKRYQASSSRLITARVTGLVPAAQGYREKETARKSYLLI